MFYKGIGLGSVIERNKARINYVIELSRDVEKVRTLVNRLIENLHKGEIFKSYTVISKLFYEHIDIQNIKIIREEINKIKNIEALKKSIMDACLTKPSKGFVWNCYYKIIYFER